VCADIRGWLDGASGGAMAGWRVDGLTRSPITGPEGNVEFLIAATRLC
jgi:23S rRNA (cytidine1920-2'-O)/16S rRNA (cytidine1409-2'-O)-methyltransferase